MTPQTGSPVESFLRELRHPREAEIRAVRAVILAASARIREEIKWNAPSFRTTEHFATFHLRAKDGVQVVLHLGAKARPGTTLQGEIPDPRGLLAWRAPDRATVTFRDLAHIRQEKAAFTRLLRHWVERVEA